MTRDSSFQLKLSQANCCYIKQKLLSTSELNSLTPSIMRKQRLREVKYLLKATQTERAEPGFEGGSVGPQRRALQRGECWALGSTPCLPCSPQALLPPITLRGLAPQDPHITPCSSTCSGPRDTGPTSCLPWVVALPQAAWLSRGRPRVSGSRDAVPCGNSRARLHKALSEPTSDALHRQQAHPLHLLDHSRLKGPGSLLNTELRVPRLGPAGGLGRRAPLEPWVGSLHWGSCPLPLDHSPTLSP